MALTITALPPFRRLPASIRQLPPSERPYALPRRPPWRIRGPVDAEGLPLFAQGGVTYQHPVRLAQQGLADLEGHRLGGGDRFLLRARRAVERLAGGAVVVDGAAYYPYPFDFALGGDRSDMMLAPWFSAMAQGQVLSLLVRLREISDSEALRDQADATFRTFLVPMAPGRPWTVFVEDGDLWLEEYAKDPPMKVLNGHLFAAFGLHDHLRVTGDPRAGELIIGAAATVRRHGEAFRDPGAVSHYCLRVPRIKSDKYHLIHQEQLRLLSRITDDPWFASLADRMAADHHVRMPSLARRAARRIRRVLAR